MNSVDAQELPAVVVKNVITTEDIKEIHQINETATTNHGFVASGNYHKVTFLQSSIKEDTSNASDANNDIKDDCDVENEAETERVTNISAFEELGGSQILNKILSKIKETDAKEWNFLTKSNDSSTNNKYGINVDKVNIRVIEYHFYSKFGGLMQKQHYDGGSILTAVIMLSDPNKDFKGGTLMSWQPKKDEFELFDTMNQCDMLLFPSHKYHSVSQVTDGQRYVLVIEIWENLHGSNFDKNRRPGSFSFLIQDAMSTNL